MQLTASSLLQNHRKLPLLDDVPAAGQVQAPKPLEASLFALLLPAMLQTGLVTQQMPLNTSCPCPGNKALQKYRSAVARVELHHVLALLPHSHSMPRRCLSPDLSLYKWSQLPDCISSVCTFSCHSGGARSACALEMNWPWPAHSHHLQQVQAGAEALARGRSEHCSEGLQWPAQLPGASPLACCTSQLSPQQLQVTAHLPSDDFMQHGGSFRVAANAGSAERDPLSISNKCSAAKPGRADESILNISASMTLGQQCACL